MKKIRNMVIKVSVSFGNVHLQNRQSPCKRDPSTTVELEPSRRNTFTSTTKRGSLEACTIESTETLPEHLSLCTMGVRIY